MKKFLTFILLACFVASSVFAEIPKKVKVSEDDTTAGYLNGKLVAGTGIAFTENNNGGNETLTVTASGIGDVSSNTATSVDSEVALFSGTGGKTIKRASGTGFGYLTSGVLSAVAILSSSHINWADVDAGELQVAGINWSSTTDLTTGGVIKADSVALGTDTTGNYAGSSSEGGAATTATALAANGSNCSAGSYPLGVDASGAIESCTDATTEIDSAISTHTANASAHHAPVTVTDSSEIDFTLSTQDVTATIKPTSLVSSKINWSSITALELQSSGFNWSSVPSETIQRSKINWSNLWVDSASGVNWGAIPGAVTDYVLTKTATGVNWQASAGGSGTIDGSGTTNEIPYWVDSDTLGSLAAATYPSLTELSYVKGVTSAIQTQLNAKESSTSNDFDPDRLAGDTTDNNLVDEAVIDSTIARDSELHSAVTVSGSPDYITLSGQDIVRGLVDLATDTTGVLARSGINWDSFYVNSASGLNWQAPTQVPGWAADRVLTATTSGVNWQAPIVTPSSTTTFTNKTIDGDDNTLQDIAYSQIKSTSRSGVDVTVVTGTKGATDDCAKWNADGDLVSAGAACGVGGGGGDNVLIDGAGVTDPDFVSTGQIDFTNTSNTITADINADSILESDLKAVDAAADEDILTYESTTGDFEWHSVTDLEASFEAVLDLSDLQGAVTDAQVPNTITVDLATVATTANAGDSATSFFSSGTVEAARLPDADDDGSTKGVANFTNADFDATAGAVSIASAITRDTEWDTEGEVQTAWGAVNILLETEIDASSELRALMDDESGTGALIFADGALGAATATTASADDNDTSVATTAYVQTEINASGGRSLTAASGSISADAELYTDTKCIRFESPVAADDLKSLWINDSANQMTVTKLWCESDQTVTAMLQVDDGTPADMDSVDLVCISTPDTDTSLDGDATIATGDRVDIDIASVSGTPTWVSICLTGTYDD